MDPRKNLSTITSLGIATRDEIGVLVPNNLFYSYPQSILQNGYDF